MTTSTLLPDGENDRGYHTALQHLITAFNYAAPNGQVQQALIHYIDMMERDGESHYSVLKYVTGTFFDGLAYGNWPEARS